MKLNSIFLFLVTLFSVVACWEPEDQAIFELQDALRKVDSKANFYSILEVEKTADSKTINKAYRKVSLQYHPDKNPSEEAAQLYKLLTSIQSTLKNKKLRKLYDKHLKRGFPVWRGNNYFYNRFEPSIPLVILLVVIFVSFAQYITAWMLYYKKKHAPPPEEVPKEVVKTYTQLKKELKKQKDAPIISKKEFKKGISSEPIKVDKVVIPQPSAMDVALVQLPLWIYNKFAQSEKPKTE
ncbi:hypothetical protein HDV01_006122 [Terramyces sp. JEL0728]|nr:hypothetical protein HDV01_006122 [Terramyces sp. JEL0728]